MAFFSGGRINVETLASMSTTRKNTNKMKMIIFYVTSKAQWVPGRLNELNSRWKKPSIFEQRNMVSAFISGSGPLVKRAVDREKAAIEGE